MTDTIKGGYIIHRDNMYAAVVGGNNTCKFWGVPNDTVYATSPSWLKINPVSGLLYGIPGLNDTNATVTAIVRDPYGLIAVTQLPLNITPAPHAPYILGAPADLCEFFRDSVQVSFIVEDTNLLRNCPNNDSVCHCIFAKYWCIYKWSNSDLTVSSGVNNVPINLNIKLASPVGVLYLYLLRQLTINMVQLRQNRF